MNIKHKTFSGGYKLKNFEGEPKETLIELGIPEMVAIPLKQGFGKEVPPVVRQGQRVKAGQIIGRDDDSISTPVHASIGGIVEEIKKIDYLHGKVDAVVIKSDGSADWQSLQGHNYDWKGKSSEKIEESLYLSGVTALNRGGIPTRYKSSPIFPGQVQDVIIHGIGSDVYSLSSFLLLKDSWISNFVDGIKILKKIMPGARFHIAFGEGRGTLIEKIYSLLDDETVTFYSLASKYPQAFDEILISTILGKTFPYGKIPTDIGVVVFHIQNVIQVYEAVTMGKPFIERTIALCGHGFRESLYVKTRIGTPVEYIIKGRINEDEDLRFVINSLLNGIGIMDLSLPLDRTCYKIISVSEKKPEEIFPFIKLGFGDDSYSNTFPPNVLGFKKIINTNMRGERRACVSCGFCEEVCPVGIIPHLIYKYFEKGIIDETLMTLKMFSCVGCNLCSYVCPSKIPVSKYIMEGKLKLINEGRDAFSFKLPYVDLKGFEEYRGIK
ncbi:MAG: 4Fe-4S dicluster domain-containing protein [bacterium]